MFRTSGFPSIDGITGWAGVTSPNCRPKSAWTSGARSWSGKNNTRCRHSAARTSATTLSPKGRERSRPRTSAPMLGEIALMSRPVVNAIGSIVPHPSDRHNPSTDGVTTAHDPGHHRPDPLTTPVATPVGALSRPVAAAEPHIVWPRSTSQDQRESSAAAAGGASGAGRDDHGGFGSDGTQAVVAAVPASTRRGPSRGLGGRPGGGGRCGVRRGGDVAEEDGWIGDRQRRVRERCRRQRGRGHSGLGLGKPSGVSVDQASTSSRGVTASSITLAFPVSNLTSLASNFGFEGDTEFGAQKAAIHTFVNAINDAGGINGRKINPIIVNFDPTNEVGHAGVVQAVDRGLSPGLRRPRRDRFVDR